jgi:hypothetical protein
MIMYFDGTGTTTSDRITAVGVLSASGFRIKLFWVATDHIVPFDDIIYIIIVDTSPIIDFRQLSFRLSPVLRCRDGTVDRVFCNNPSRAEAELELYESAVI